MTLKSKVIQGVKWSSLSTVVIATLHLIQLAILARFLEPNAFGLMALVMVVIGFSQAFQDMGISNAIIHKAEVTIEQLSILYWVNILAGFFLFLVVMSIAPFIADFYKEEELTKLIFIVGLTFIIQPFGQQFMVLWQKEMRFNDIAKVTIINKLVSLFVSVYLAFRGYGVYALVYGTLFGVISQTALFMYLGLKEYRPRLIFKLSEIKEFLKFGSYQMGEKSFNYISANIDKILIGKFISMEALGFYNLAWQLIIFPLSKINPVVNNVAFPVYAKVQNYPLKLSDYYTKFSSALFLLTVPLLVFMFFFANEIVNLAYGNGWEQITNLLSVLTLVGLLKLGGNSSGPLILAIGKVSFSFWWNFVWMILITITLYLAVVISSNVHWVASSLLILSSSTVYLYHHLVQKISGVDYKQLCINFCRILFFSLIIGKASFTIITLMNTNSYIINLIFGGSIYITLYGLYIIKYENGALKLLKKGYV